MGDERVRGTMCSDNKVSAVCRKLAVVMGTVYMKREENHHMSNLTLIRNGSELEIGHLFYLFDSK